MSLPASEFVRVAKVRLYYEMEKVIDGKLEWVPIIRTENPLPIWRAKHMHEKGVFEVTTFRYIKKRDGAEEDGFTDGRTKVQNVRRIKSGEAVKRLANKIVESTVKFKFLAKGIKKTIQYGEFDEQTVQDELRQVIIKETETIPTFLKTLQTTLELKFPTLSQEVQEKANKRYLLQKEILSLPKKNNAYRDMLYDQYQRTRLCTLQLYYEDSLLSNQTQTTAKENFECFFKNKDSKFVAIF